MHVDRHELKWDDMLAGIRAQPEYLRGGAVSGLYAAAAGLPLRVPSRVYLVGCGDSHYAGLATRFAFERWSGVPTEALESLEFSRYAVESALSDALVVAVSNSGRVVRTVECARVAGQRGITSLGLTHHAGSPLAAAASMLLECPFPDVGFGPGTLSYMASLVGLYSVALRIGTLTGRLDDAAAGDILETIAGAGDAVSTTIDANIDLAGRVAASLTPDGLVCILGGGPNYATALFGMAKFIEAAAHPAVGQELEEWAHEQYFCTRPGTTTFVLAPPGASVDRAREQLQAVRDMEGQGIAICVADDRATSELADAVLPVVLPEDELLSPLVAPLPLELVTLAFAQRLGRTMLGFDDDRRRAVNFRQIFGSADPLAKVSASGGQTAGGASV